MTTTPAIWIGGRLAGPSESGVSPIGSGSARVSPPTVIGGKPRSMAPSPMVAMITAMIGLPSSGRSTTRSSAKLNSTMTATAAATPASAGMPW